jgi:hypothetical protein
MKLIHVNSRRRIRQLSKQESAARRKKPEFWLRTSGFYP